MRKSLIPIVVTVTGLTSAYFVLRNKDKRDAMAVELTKASVKQSRPTGQEAEVDQPIKGGDIVHIPIATRVEAVAKVEDAEDVPMEEGLMTGLKSDPSIEKIAEVGSVTCSGKSCQVALEARDPDSAGGLQMTVLKFLQANPQYGTNFKISTSEDSHITLFTFSRD